MERLSDYDYDLPESSIAQRPLEDRAASRMLWLHRGTGRFEDRMFRDAPDLLREGDLLVVNDTRVTAVRLLGQKATGGRVELLVLRELAAGEFECLAKPGRRLQPGAAMEFEQGLRATVLENLPEGRKRVRFDAEGDVRERLAGAGSVPLPHYISERLEDAERYQTVYASTAGSAAAPTAGLHFTPKVLEDIRRKGVAVATVTLDVGLDTFRPVQAEDPAQHPIHGERCSVSEETAGAIEGARGRIVAVGTTTVRTLETFARGERRVLPGSQESRLFIRPGYRFQIVDGMFTNFHMPRTTMLMMISAMAGRDAVMRSYAHAVSAGYRFLSFGDSMVIL